jgi:bacillithiol biosynthesis cysteine-adding enzyme BshC
MAVTSRVKITGGLPWDRVPETSALFADFLGHFEKVAEFFPEDPHSLVEHLDPETALSGRDFFRQELGDILERQNRSWDGSAETMANVERLRRPDTFTVVTGQQVGLFTGPLYAVYKALSVLQLTRRLQRHLGQRFVPLFWMAADDHDYREVDHAVLLDRAGQPATVRHPGSYSPDRPVGSLTLGPKIEKLLAQVGNLLPDNEFRDGVMELFSSAYRPTDTFAGAFARAMLALFADRGLVLVDPTDPALKRLCRPLFDKELALSPGSAGLVVERGEELIRRGYHAQLHLSPDGVNLFVIQDGRRSGLVAEGGEFRLKGSDRRLSRESLQALLQRSPESFSPNAALRPLMQDSLFPVAAYVAGPSEVAYLAQLGPLYERFGIPRSPIYPRISLTLMEERLGELLRDSGLGLGDVFVEADRLVGRLSQAHMPPGLEEEIAAAQAQVREAFERLSQRILDLEPTMEGYLRSVSGKVQHHLKAVRKKLLQAQRARDRSWRERSLRISHHLYPDGHLQERLLNIIPFLARHGLGLIGHLDALDIEPWQHGVITLQGG